VTGAVAVVAASPAVEFTQLAVRFALASTADTLFRCWLELRGGGKPLVLTRRPLFKSSYSRGVSGPAAVVDSRLVLTRGMGAVVVGVATGGFAENDVCHRSLLTLRTGGRRSWADDMATPGFPSEKGSPNGDGLPSAR